MLRTPRGPGWRRDTLYDPVAAVVRTGGSRRAVDAARAQRIPAQRWYHFARERVLCAVTSLDEVVERGPTWHVSVSRVDERTGKPSHATDADFAFAREAFRMRDAEEDNHALDDGQSAGVARHLFMEVDPAKRTTCECKATEEVVQLPDGYEYSRPRSGRWAADE